MTSLSDFFQPEIANDYFALKMLEKSLLISSGIAVMTPELSAAVAVPGNIVEVPSFNPLLASDAPTLGTDDDTALVPFDVSGNDFIARKNYRNASWKAPEIISYSATGVDVLTPAILGYVDYWTQRDQLLLIQMLTGLFTTELAANSVDVSKEDEADIDADTLIGSGVVIDTQFVLGDRYSSFGAIAMHSVPFKRLVNLDLITYVPTSEQNPTIMPTYMGMRVLVDDSLPVRAITGVGTGNVYTSYLFGTGSVGYGVVPAKPDSPMIELYREPTKGGGTSVKSIITRNNNILSPIGCSFTGTPAGISPTDAEYALSTNWSLSWDQKRIPIAQLLTNG